MTSSHTPWHFWVLAVLGVLWFSGGAYDYVMTSLGDEDYLSILTPEQRSWMDARPVWFTACWAVSVWASLLGAVVMLLRNRAAGMLFLLSIAAYLPCVVWSYGLADPSSYDVTGMFGVVFSVIIFLTLLFFVTYCAAMAQRGVLR